MDESERQSLLATLAVARRDRKELDQLIGYLVRRLGVTDDGFESEFGDGGAVVQPTPPGVIPASLVADGEFFGMSATKASKALMEKLGRTRPLKTREIFDAIKKGGVIPANTETLYKSLQRSREFELVQKGTWGLSAWYGTRSRNAKRGAGPSDDLDSEGGSPDEPVEDIGVQT